MPRELVIKAQSTKLIGTDEANAAKVNNLGYTFNLSTEVISHI